MYFTTSFWFGLMLVVCALLQTPMASYFDTELYDATIPQMGNSFKTVVNILDTIKLCCLQLCCSIPFHCSCKLIALCLPGATKLSFVFLPFSLFSW